jgi:hypothetical protein
MKTIKVNSKEELIEKIKLREAVIENQRKLIDTLRTELNKKHKWWKFWK